MRAFVFGILSLFLLGNPVLADEGKRKEDEAAIRENLTKYVEAYRQKDAAALAAMWSESGKFLDPLTGDAIEGRKGIEEAFGAMFAESEEEVVLEATIVSLRFLTDEVAVEEGEARVVRPGMPPTVGEYQAIHVKKDGRWLIDSVRETAAIEVVSEAGGAGVPEEEGGVPELEELAWMIGEWDDVGEGATIELSCSWGMGKSFIRRDFAVVVEDRVALDGIEVIGWDASEKKFRSWVFDSGGGFGSAVWEKMDGGEWHKRMQGTTKDGKKVFAIHVVKSIDENTYEWRAHGREMDGVLLPNIDPVKVVRVLPEEAEEQTTEESKQ